MVGVALAQRYRMYGIAWIWWVLPVLAVSLRRHGIVALTCFVIVAAGFGCVRGTQYMDKKSRYTQLEGQSVVLTATANTDAVYGKRSQLTFDVRNAYATAPVAGPLVGSLQVSGFGAPMVYKGDLVEVRGKLFSSRGNNLGRLSYAKIAVVERRPSYVDELRRKFAAGIQSAVPEPAASFGMGLLVGQRNTLPQETSEQLRLVGLTHVIAVSGYNLTIIMQAVGRLMKNRSKFQYVAASILLVTTFLLLAGSSPSIVRASVVCGLGLAAWYYGRTIKPVALLMTAGAITIAVNPLYAWGNVSWMLSFLAFFGVLVVAPVVTKRFYRKRQPGLAAAVVVESLCAEVMTLPYVLYIFGEMSVVSTLANLLVAAFVPLAMLTSLIAGLAGMFVPAFAGWLAWPATLVMTYMLDMVAILSRLPHAFASDIGFSLAMMAVSYGIVLSLTALIWHKVTKNGKITDNTASNIRSEAMSGHSKWSTIKREKGAKDAARGALFTKLGNAIAIAARSGADADMNFALRLAIDKAKAANMPTANIQRSIDRGSGKLGGEQIQEVMYEGYGPAGVAILVECATDNLNRTYPEVKLAFSKHGGNIAEKGAVAFQFERKGVIRVQGAGDDLMMQALEAGAEDVQEEDGESVVYTDPKELAKVREGLQTAGVPIVEAELTFVPNNTVHITDEVTAGKIMRLMDALEASDDVTATHVNFDIPDELIK